MAVLCLQQQLTDLNKFCCDPHNFSVLGTYCLAEFSVTPTVYRHLLLEHHKTQEVSPFCWPSAHSLQEGILKLQMTKEQRKRAIRKFHSARVHEVRIPSTTSQPPRHDNPPVVSTPATTASSSAPTSQSLLCLLKTWVWCVFSHTMHWRNVE